jgi:hypothetical protein
VRALDPRVIGAVYTAVEALLPRVRLTPIRWGVIVPASPTRSVSPASSTAWALGCSCVDAGRLVGVGQATLRRRRDEWIAAGVFDALIEEAIAGYDRIRGLDLSEASIDG